MCKKVNARCYAENALDALNEVTDRCMIYPYDVGNRLCNEIDTLEDLYRIRALL